MDNQIKIELKKDFIFAFTNIRGKFCKTESESAEIADWWLEKLDLAVAEERKRIVEEIENMDKSPEEEKFTQDKFENTENMNRVFMRVGYRKALKDTISLINKTQ